MSKKLFATPFLLWIACGTVIPLAVIAFYGFTDRSGAFTADNIMAIFSAEHAQALGLALLLSLLSTVICFVLAFPLGPGAERQQHRSERFYDFYFHSAYVDEFPAAHHGLAGAP